MILFAGKSQDTRNTERADTRNTERADTRNMERADTRNTERADVKRNVNAQMSMASKTDQADSMQRSPATNSYNDTPGQYGSERSSRPTIAAKKKCSSPPPPIKSLPTAKMPVNKQIEVILQLMSM